MAIRAGLDYIGVGVGAIVFNREGKVFLAKRGMQARNEQGTWEFPGGQVSFGETLTSAVVREFQEEYSIIIRPIHLLGVHDHILSDKREHWVSPTYIAQHIAGIPTIKEKEKCQAIGWFFMKEIPTPLSQVTQKDIRLYQEKYGDKSNWYTPL